MTTQTSAIAVRPPLPPGDYILDPAHTSVGFVGRHLMVTKVRGTFPKAEARIHVGETLESSSLEVTIDVASVQTRDEKRDNHLRSADFFDVEHYPSMTFRATHAEAVGEGRYAITGDLTIRDQTHPVTLDTQFLGAEKTPWGTQAAAVSASAEIDRERWGLMWNVALESGRFLVSKMIQLEIDAEVVPAPAPA
jgi:polyisoprenoid-binding protein YceI